MFMCIEYCVIVLRVNILYSLLYSILSVSYKVEQFFCFVFKLRPFFLLNVILLFILNISNLVLS